jgi:hypothetical protein
LSSLSCEFEGEVAGVVVYRIVYEEVGRVERRDVRKESISLVLN